MDVRQAIARWRAQRHALLAELVDVLAPPPATIRGRDKPTYHRAWLETATRAATTDDPAAIGALAAGIVKSLPEVDVGYFTPDRDLERRRALLDRIAALARCADDPRIANALCGVLEKPPFSVDDCDGVYGPVIELLVRTGDARSVARLRALVDRPLAKTATLRDYFARALPRAADQIETAVRRAGELPAGERGELEALLAARAPRPKQGTTRAVDLAELVADCIAHPDDDGPREVLADALLEREDPRGDFIQLQLRDARHALGESERKRMASLLRKHEKVWLGDLARVTKLRIWRRGFLDEAELLQGSAADAATWARVVDDPLLASIRTLHKGDANEERYASFVRSPAMRLLRDVEVPSTAMLRELGAVDHALLHAGLTKEALALLERAPIRRLSFEVKKGPRELVEQIASWPTRARFSELTAMPHYRIATEWYDYARWLLAFDELAPVKRIGIQWWGGNRVVVERGTRGLRAEVRANDPSTLTRMLEHELEKLVVWGNPHPWTKPGPELGAQLAKLPAGVVELNDGWAALRP